MSDDSANKIDDALEGLIEFVLRLLRTAFYVVFNWKRLVDELLEEQRTKVVGARVLLVSAVVLTGFVSDLDSEFDQLEPAQKLSYLSTHLGDLVNLSLKDALVHSAPFFVVALLASALIGRLGPDYAKLRDIVHYGIGGVCLTFYLMLFVAAFLVSYLLDSLSAPILIGFPLLLVVTYLALFLVRLRYGAKRILAGATGDESGLARGALLFVINATALIATVTLLILRPLGMM